MDTPHLRLQEARRKAGFETASDAARAFGWNENTYRSHENGERGLRPGVAARYAQAFRTPSSWLLLGTTTGVEIRVENKNPLLILRDGGVDLKRIDGTAYFLDGTTLYTGIVHRCTMVETEKYDPRYRLGDLIFTTDPQSDSLMWREDVLFSDRNGRMHFGSLTRFRDESLIRTLDGDLIPLEDVKEAEVVMAVLKRAFYEVRSEIRARPPL